MEDDEQVIYNHMFDIAFTVETFEKDPDKIPSTELVQALLRRMFRLIDSGEFVVGDTVAHVDTANIEFIRREGGVTTTHFHRRAWGVGDYALARS